MLADAQEPEGIEALPNSDQRVVQTLSLIHISPSEMFSAPRDAMTGTKSSLDSSLSPCHPCLLYTSREEVWCGLDVVGGRLAQEPPNIINIHARSQVAGTLSVGFGDPQRTAGMIFKDAYAYAIAEDGSRVDIAHYDPVKKQPVFSEPKCGVCGSPWPASHRFCEVCLHDEHHSRGKKQRRRK